MTSIVSSLLERGLFVRVIDSDYALVLLNSKVGARETVRVRMTLPVVPPANAPVWLMRESVMHGDYIILAAQSSAGAFAWAIASTGNQSYLLNQSSGPVASTLVYFDAGDATYTISESSLVDPTKTLDIVGSGNNTYIISEIPA